MSRPWAILLGLVLAVAVALNFFGPSYPAEKIWEIRGFFVVYGFVGCVVIIYVSKAVGKHWLLTDRSYYDPHHAPEEVGEAGGHEPERRIYEVDGGSDA